MPLRLLEIKLPDAALGELRSVLEDHAVVDLWAVESESSPDVARVLLDAQEVEPVSDQLMERFGSSEDFRLTVLGVEATLPEVEETDDQEEKKRDQNESAKRQRISREELYEDLATGSRLTVTYAVMVALSTLVAAVGLIRGDVAVIIGAMVIAPLLAPNIALSLAATLGDLDLARRSLKTAWVGAAIAAALSVLVGMTLQIDPSTPEFAARTHVGLGDIILALSAGAAGTLAFTSGVPAVVVGVMVAVALLPPLVATGLLLGAGHGALAMRAALLVLTNVTCVNLASVATFLLQKVRPRSWWEEDRAKKATRIAVATWVLMLVVLLVLILLSQEAE